MVTCSAFTAQKHNSGQRVGVGRETRNWVGTAGSTKSGLTSLVNVILLPVQPHCAAPKHTDRSERGGGGWVGGGGEGEGGYGWEQQ